jgi:hypothetical protein
MKKLGIQALGLTFALVVVGCTDLSNTIPPADTAVESPVVKQAKTVRPNAAAGVTVDKPTVNQNLWTELVNNRRFSTRPDPFALQARERSFESSQTTERLFGTEGFRSPDFEYVPEVVVVPVQEPQPYRRLAGVIVGDSVLALIDMHGDGQLTLIRPGQMIDGWEVVSIDSEKAILRRGGNLLPREITVRLEEPNPLRGGGGGGGTGGGPSPGTGGGGNGNRGSFSG